MKDDIRAVRDIQGSRSSRPRIDFHQVVEHHREIDSRLINWGRWCNGSGAPAVCPMFRMVPPPPRVRSEIFASVLESVDGADAAVMAKAVVALPSPHRAAVNWAYVKPVNPRRACQDIGTTMEAWPACCMTAGRC